MAIRSPKAGSARSRALPGFPVGLPTGLHLAPGLALAAILVLLLPAGKAHAHSTVLPGASRPADLQLYTVTVPTERRADTTSVSLQVPSGIDFVLVRPAPGWRVRLEKQGGRITVLRWTGGSIPPDSFDSFQFIARNPATEGILEWKIVQRYDDGETVSWIGPASSETPASRTTITESATPVDVVSVQGQDVAAKPAAGSGGDTGGAKSASESDDSGDLPLILSIVALVAAAASLLLAFRRRRTV